MNIMDFNQININALYPIIGLFDYWRQIEIDSYENVRIKIVAV
jgi:hypothetical protein